MSGGTRGEAWSPECVEDVFFFPDIRCFFRAEPQGAEVSSVVKAGRNLKPHPATFSIACLTSRAPWRMLGFHGTQFRTPGEA